MTGKVGQTVEYKVTVKNTGNVTLKFAALKDSDCKASPRPARPNSQPAKKSPSPARHMLAVGSYTNEASIEGNEGTGTQTSNKVTAKVPAEPTFMIEKQQRIAGRRHLHLRRTHRQTRPGRRIQDHRPQHRQRGAQIRRHQRHRLRRPLAERRDRTRGRQQEEFFTCTHTLGAVGSYVNEASIEGNEGTGTKTSNKATTKVAAEPSYAIEKQQRVNGEGTFGVSEASGKLGQTVEYKVIVKNTGNVALKFTALKDTGCEGLSPSGTTELAAGNEETFTCSHKLAAVGTYTNKASIEGNEGTGKKTSNKVKAKVASEPSFTIEKQQRDHRRRHLRHRRSVRQNRPDRRIQDHRQEHRQRHPQIQRPHRHRLLRHHAVRRDRTESRGRRDLHLHPLALGGRQLHQRSLDRRQRRHRQKDVQQSHRQSRRRTVLHHREAAADRRRRHLHLRRTHRQSRPGGRIQDHRPQHRQRGAQIRRHERHRLHRPLAVGHDRSR